MNVAATFRLKSSTADCHSYRSSRLGHLAPLEPSRPRLMQQSQYFVYVEANSACRRYRNLVRLQAFCVHNGFESGRSFL